MSPDEFVAKVKSEAPRSITVPGHTSGTVGSRKLSDILRSGAGPSMLLTYKYGHLLGPAASMEAIDRWRYKYPACALPPDLVAMLQRFDGIHLWADLEIGRSYFGLAPMDEWAPYNVKFPSRSSDRAMPADEFVISYHQDSAQFVSLSCSSGTYSSGGTAAPSRKSSIGQSVSALLDYWWKNRMPP